MPCSFVAPIESRRIAGEEAPHRALERPGARSHEQVKMVWHQRPSKDLERLPLDEPTEAPEKVLPVFVVEEDEPTLDPASYDVMQSSVSVEPRTSGHRIRLVPEGGRRRVTE